MFSGDIRFVFYYPDPSIGGAQLLFARIAEALIKDGYRVLIVEHDHCFIHNYLLSQQLKFEWVLVSEKKHFATNENDILILSLSFVFIVQQFIDVEPRTRIILWDLHTYALIESTAFSIIHKKFPDSFLSSLMLFAEKGFLRKMNVFVTEASKRHSLYFMCLQNFLTNQRYFNLDFEPTYLPLPIDVDVTSKINNNLKKKKITINKTLNIGWIGRMDADKTPILKLLVADVINFNIKHDDIKIFIHAIGDENVCGKLFNAKSGIGDVLKLPGVLFGETLDIYLRKNIDVGFSMGTAALEFASRKIPTVLVPSTIWYKLFKKNRLRYFWLFDSSGYDLGVENYHLENKCQDFESIVSAYFRNKLDYSNNSYNYVINNHELNQVYKQFK